MTVKDFFRFRKILQFVPVKKVRYLSMVVVTVSCKMLEGNVNFRLNILSTEFFSFKYTVAIAFTAILLSVIVICKISHNPQFKWEKGSQE